MRKSRFTTEQIIGFLKQVEAGMAVADLCRQHGFSPASLRLACGQSITAHDHKHGMRCASSSFGVGVLHLSAWRLDPCSRRRCQ